MYQILHQSERTQPAANKSSQQASEKEEKAQCGKGNLKSVSVQQRLQSPYGAGAQGSGTRIAVQSRRAGIFQPSPINPPIEKAVQIPVRENREQQLHAQPYFFHDALCLSFICVSSHRHFPPDISPSHWFLFTFISFDTYFFSYLLLFTFPDMPPAAIQTYAFALYKSSIVILIFPILCIGLSPARCTPCRS